MGSMVATITVGAGESTNGSAPNQSDEELYLEQIWVRLPDAAGMIDGPAPPPKSAENAEFDSAERFIAVATKGEGTLSVWDRDGNEIVEIYAGAEQEALTFLHGPDRPDQYIVTGGEQLSFDEPPQPSDELQVYEFDPSEPSLRKVRGWSVGYRGIEGLRLSPDRTLLATGDEAGEVRWWDVSDPDPLNWPGQPIAVAQHGADEDHPVHTAEGHADVNQLDWSDDGQYVYSAGRNALVRKWRVTRDGDGISVEEDSASPFRGHQGSIKCVRVSPDGTMVASGDSAGSSRSLNPALVTVHDTATGEILMNARAPKMRIIETVEWTPDGKYLLAGGQDAGREQIFGHIAIWSRAAILSGENPPPTQRLYVAEQEYFDFTDDGAQLVYAGSDGSLRLYSVGERPRGAGVAGPEPAQPAADGRITLEAEHYHARKDAGDHRWERRYFTSASRGEAVKAGPDYHSNDPNDIDFLDDPPSSPRLDYWVHFPAPGVYAVRVRGRTWDDDRARVGHDPSDNAIMIGLNGERTDSSAAIEIPTPANADPQTDWKRWFWTAPNSSGEGATIRVPAAGVHTVNLWMGESGAEVDQLVLVPLTGE